MTAVRSIQKGKAAGLDELIPEFFIYVIDISLR